MRRNSRNVNCPSPPARSHALGFQSPPLNPRPAAGGFVKIQAYAKINLYLDVIGRRDDGYHNIVSVMQSLSLCDDLAITDEVVVGGIPQEQGEVYLTCTDPTLPVDDSNLIVKAAKLLIHEYEIKQNIHIHLTKRIPVGAGLAGGSSNCAATLRGVNELFQLNIPKGKLMEYGASLGADVPFCLTGGTALAEGIGEKITPLPHHPNCYIVVVCPNIHVATATAYSRLDAVKNRPPGQDKTSLMTALAAQDVSQIAANFFNIFTFVTADMHPEISQIIRELKALGALGAEMSGTGSAVFGYFGDKNKAQAACDKITHKTFLTVAQGATPQQSEEA